MSGCGISGTFYASRKAFRTSIADCVTIVNAAGAAGNPLRLRVC